MHSEANFTMYFVKYKMEGEDLKASVLYWAAANLTFSLKTGVGATGRSTCFFLSDLGINLALFIFTVEYQLSSW